MNNLTIFIIYFINISILMRNYSLKLCAIALFLSALVACNKQTVEVVPETTPDAANKFMGRYVGAYAEISDNGSIIAEKQSVVVTKSSEKELTINISVWGINFSLNGTVQNDSLVTITDRKYMDKELTSGTVLLRGKNNLCVKLMTKDTDSPTVVSVSYDGIK
jgi:hypothetical protein